MIPHIQKTSILLIIKVGDKYFLFKGSRKMIRVPFELVGIYEGFTKKQMVNFFGAKMIRQGEEPKELLEKAAKWEEEQRDEGEYLVW